MRILKSIPLVFASVVVVFAGQPLSNLSVSLKGKQYDVSGVTTVKDLQKKVKAASGVEESDMGLVVFGGKPLEPEAVLSDVGVSDGAKLNIVSSGMPSKEEMEAMLKDAGIDSDKLDEMMKSIGGDMPSLEESMKAMTDVMNSPMFQEMMSDPERLEQSRQMILNNPMLKGMMGSMPGMEELINDENAWREAMQAAAELYKNMNPDDLMKAMMGGGGGAMDMDMFGNGLPTLDNSAAAAALDELDEDD